MKRFVLAALGAVSATLAFAVWQAFAVPAALRDVPGQTAFVIEGADIVSMDGAVTRREEGLSILVRGGRIERIAPASEMPKDVPALEAEGLTAVPGLTDMHVHLWDEAELGAYLAHGVTSIRNMSGMPFHLPLQERIERGDILGPALFTTGPILNSPGPNQQDNHVLVSTEDEARRAVRAQFGAGYRHLKTYSNLTAEAYRGIREEAETLGMTISGHTPEGRRQPGMPSKEPFGLSFAEVADDGFLSIEHTESIVWHGLRDRLDPDGMAALAGMIAGTGSAVTPTLVAHANLVRQADSGGAYAGRPGTEFLNPLVTRLEEDGVTAWAGVDPDVRERPRAAFYLRATKLLHGAGVPILAGSDAGIFVNPPGLSLHDELDLLVTAGLSPGEAIAAATRTPGLVLGEARGQLAEGFLADILLVEGNPLEDVSVLRRPRTVIAAGRILNADRLARLRRSAAEDGSLLRSGRRAVAMLSGKDSF